MTTDYPITCHEHERQYPDYDVSRWEPARVTTETVEVNGEEVLADNWSQPFRTCRYCGSIHPVDLLEIWKRDEFERVHVVSMPTGPLTMTNVEWADFKYGYPHKLYVRGIPNPNAGRKAVTGRRYEGGELVEKFVSVERSTWAKFYTRHLFDRGLLDQPELLKEIVDAIARESGLFLDVRVEDGQDLIGWRRAS